MNKTMNITLLFFLVACLTGCNHCEKGSDYTIKTERALSPFSKIEIKGSFEVYIVKDNTSKVIVEAEDNVVPWINTSVFSDVLTIGMRDSRCFRKTSAKIITIHTPQISSVNLVGSGSIDAPATFEGKSLTILIDGSGNANMNFDGEQSDLTINGSGKITLGGKSDISDLKINGSGEIDSRAVMSEHVKAVIDGSGRIITSAAVSLKAEINGSGNITYNGSPAIETKVRGSGTIHPE